MKYAAGRTAVNLEIEEMQIKRYFLILHARSSLRNGEIAVKISTRGIQFIPGNVRIKASNCVFI